MCSPFYTTYWGCVIFNLFLFIPWLEKLFPYHRVFVRGDAEKGGDISGDIMGKVRGEAGAETSISKISVQTNVLRTF